ncbi:MAG: hypothetical protein ACFFKA_12905 [Candidatus Thorarchaeota archaeon]
MRADTKVDTFCTLCDVEINVSSSLAKLSSQGEKVLYFFINLNKFSISKLDSSAENILNPLYDDIKNNL